jgi:hypothetical protein
MGNEASKALSCFEERKNVSSRDLEKLRKRYKVFLGQNMSKKEAQRFIEDMRAFVDVDAIYHTEVWVEKYSKKSIPFRELFLQVVEHMPDLKMTLSAVVELSDTDSTGDKERKEFGNVLSQKELIMRRSVEEKKALSFAFSAADCIQDSPLTKMPKDVIISSLCCQLSLGEINALARTCRRLFLFINVILCEMRPPKMYLLERMEKLPKIVGEAFTPPANFYVNAVKRIEGKLVRFSIMGQVYVESGSLLRPAGTTGMVHNFHMQNHSPSVLEFDRFVIFVNDFEKNNKFFFWEKATNVSGVLGEVEVVGRARWFLHQSDKRAGKFGFAFKSNHMVVELSVCPIEPECSGDDLIFPILDQFVLIQFKAMGEPRGDIFGSVSTNYPRRIKQPTEDLVVLTGEGFLDEMLLYDADARTWRKRMSSGYLPTRESNTKFFHIEKHWYLLASTKNSGHGNMYYFNAKMAFFHCCTFGTIRIVPKIMYALDEPQLFLTEATRVDFHQPHVKHSILWINKIPSASSVDEMGKLDNIVEADLLKIDSFILSKMRQEIDGLVRRRK